MKKFLKEDLWRHAFALVICFFVLFPIYLVFLSALSPTGSLQVTSFIPKTISFRNFHMLFSSPTIPYLVWMKNSIMIAGTVAILSVVIGAASAFAFSRLRFKGKKQGLQLLLLVQMFPAILSLSAVYVIMERVYSFAPRIGLGTQPGLLYSGVPNP